MVLLDWTRMGHSYCLAGAIHQGGEWRIVRPLMNRHRDGPARNMGWSPYLMDGHQRWEVFELVSPHPAPPEAPHLEDVWVHSLRSRQRLAEREIRRAILQATCPPPEQPLFGALLQPRWTGGYLPAGTGCRSLVCTLVRADQITFRLVRKGDDRVSYRVHLETAELEKFMIPVTDHSLLSRAEQAYPGVEERLAWMAQTVAGLGERVAIRLGVSRPYAGDPARDEPVCWLMADGFFSPTDPQP
jgi:hypothetical protein